MSAFNTVCVWVFIYGTGMILAVLFYEILKKIAPRAIAFALMFTYCFSIGGPSAKFYQFIIISLGGVLVPHPVTTAPFNLLTFSLGRLKVILVIRGNPV